MVMHRRCCQLLSAGVPSQTVSRLQGLVANQGERRVAGASGRLLRSCGDVLRGDDDLACGQCCHSLLEC